MTFEEFFKKKKISLPLLQDAEPALFAEFEHHYGQMGEKSFDHTKKYWFNQLRHRFPLPPEVKVEKLTTENPLAEQTITESLTEQATPAASVGFKPRFKATATPQSTEEKQPVEPAGEAKPTEEKPADNTPAPSVGFKPRFKASMVAKPAEEKAEDKPAIEPAAQATPAEETPKPTVGFKPRFKASMVTKPAEEKPEEKPAESLVDEASPTEEKPAGQSTSTAPVENAPKPAGLKPRFNMNKMKPKDPEAE
ncbi:hypothetical protein HQ865_20490 [Mucilaginibacter mali]|uniref:Uncharacterized protein n=1 Tax=Mucilaginibacter mali TaxID=2740462 RepID=A0A7D4UNJ2_9SPHI|nr:hypothetical protein [Mucilaginibacter mali]QKJ32041.1 hypothetical protein HQ865_20490 [Mucilaginibacter mali]